MLTIVCSCLNNLMIIFIQIRLESLEASGTLFLIPESVRLHVEQHNAMAYNTSRGPVFTVKELAFHTDKDMNRL